MVKKHTKGKGSKKQEEQKPYVPIRDEEGYFLWHTALVERNPGQPRKDFNEEGMANLRASIEEGGIKQPIKICVINKSGKAIIVDGERRWRCAKQLGMQMMPVILETEHLDFFAESVVMNFAREDMTPLECSRAIDRLMNSKGWNQAEIARKIGKSPGWVSNTLKLLKLERTVAKELEHGEINPAMALAASRAPKKDQPKIVIGLKKAQEKKGGKLTPQEIAVEAARVAKEEDICIPRAPKGREPAGHETLLVKQAIRLFGGIEVVIKEILTMSDEDLELAGGAPLIELQQLVQHMEGDVSRLAGKLRIVV